MFSCNAAGECLNLNEKKRSEAMLRVDCCLAKRKRRFLIARPLRRKRQLGFSDAACRRFRAREGGPRED